MDRFVYRLIFLFMFLLSALHTTAQEIRPYDYHPMLNWDTSPYKSYSYHSPTFSSRQSINFRLLYPQGFDSSATNPDTYPLVLVLHGSGESAYYYYDPSCSCKKPYPEGHEAILNNDNQLLFGAQEHLKASKNGSLNGFVLFPQNFYGTWINGEGLIEEGPYVDIEITLELLEYLIEKLPVDPDRVYIHGLSNGAGGVLSATWLRPDLFAAALPMSHAGDPAMAEKIYDIPLWFFQGGLDDNPNPAKTQKTIDEFKHYNSKYLRYTLYEQSGHNIWGAAYREPDFFSWIMGHRKNRITADIQQGEDCSAEIQTAELHAPRHFKKYEWEKDGNMLSGQTSYRLTTTEPGSYRMRFQRLNGKWSDWSDPFKLGNARMATKAITISEGLQSTALPALDGSNSLTLKAKAGYEAYRWSNGETSREISIQQAGSYSVQVMAADSCFSQQSNSINVTTAAGSQAPEAPGDFNASAGSDATISLSWQDKSTREDVFEIYRSNASGGYELIAKPAPNSSSYTDRTAAPDTDYQYQLRAVNQHGASDYIVTAFTASADEEEDPEEADPDDGEDPEEGAPDDNEDPDDKPDDGDPEDDEDPDNDEDKPDDSDPDDGEDPDDDEEEEDDPEAGDPDDEAEPVVLLEISGSNATEVGLSWQVSADLPAAAQFIVYQYTASEDSNGRKGVTTEMKMTGKGLLPLDSTGDTYYIVENLLPATDYTFVIKAKNEKGNLLQESNLVNIQTSAENQADPYFKEFNYRLQDPEIQLYWQIAAEELPDGQFIVEKATQQHDDFTPIGTLNSMAHGSIYSFRDLLSTTESLFYRIRLKETAKVSRYSPILQVDPLRELNEEILLYPNPVHQGELLTIYLSPKIYKSGKEIEVQLINAAGQVVFESMTLESISINTHQLEPGNYSLMIKNRNGTFSSRLIILK